MSDEPTPGELGRSMTELKGDIYQLRKDLRETRDGVIMLRDLDDRVTALESFHAWLVRIVLGAIVAALLALVLIR